MDHCLSEEGTGKSLLRRLIRRLISLSFNLTLELFLSYGKLTEVNEEPQSKEKLSRTMIALIWLTVALVIAVIFLIIFDPPRLPKIGIWCSG